MQLLLFIIMLLFHLVFCKKKLNSFTLPFSLYGIIWFTVLIATRLPIVNFEPYSGITIIIYLGAYFMFLIPHLFVNKTQIHKSLSGIVVNANVDALKRVYFGVFIVYCVFAGLYAMGIIHHYGSLSFIFKNAYYVRYDAMSRQIVPLAVSYGICVGYVAAGIGSYLLFFNNCRLTTKVLYMLPLFISLCTDSLTSGRMGILFYLIIYLSSMMIKINLLSKKDKKKYRRIFFITIAMALIVLFIPKLVRDSSVGATDYFMYTQYLANENVLKIPLIGPIMHYFMYITGSVVAFDKYIVNASDVHTYGVAQLLPLVHFLNRLTGAQTDYNLIYEFVNIPFETNIYTYLREAYSDFGAIGVIITPLFLGLICCMVFTGSVKNKYLSVVWLQYVFLYSIFSVFYTPFSQGGPTIGFALYFIVVFVMVRSGQTNANVFLYQKKEHIYG